MSFSQNSTVKQQIQSRILAQHYGLDIEDLEQLVIAKQLQKTRRQGKTGHQNQSIKQQIKNQLLAQELGLDLEDLEQLSIKNRRQGRSNQQTHTLKQQIRNEQLAEELGLDLEDLEQLSINKQLQKTKRQGDYDQQHRHQSLKQRIQSKHLAEKLGLDEEDFEELSITKQVRDSKQKGNSDVAEVVKNGDKSTIKIDLHQFRPQEIEVKTKGNILVVRAEHEEREDKNGTVEREFQRKFVLPDDIEPEDIVANVSKNGELKIEVKDNLQQLKQLIKYGYSGNELVESDNSEDEFSVRLDLSQFKPQEIEVKTNGNTVVVHAQHEERVDRYGSVEREIKRKYVLPENIDPEDIITTVTKEGILKIDTKDTKKGSKKSHQKNGTGRQIPIQYDDSNDKEIYRPIHVNQY